MTAARSSRVLAAALSDPRTAQRALLQLSRIECEASLATFTQQAWAVIEPATALKWNWHLDALCAYVQAFFEGRIKRLIVNVPPGSMKSIVFSVMGPAWCWTRRPESRMLCLSNELGLARRDNRRMRQVIESTWFRERWGALVTLSRDQAEKSLFENTRLGFRQSLGLTGNVTGKRGNFLLIDDPVDAKKAFSDGIVREANQTYDHAVASRLNDPVEDSIGVIMQRLRDDDLTGHLLAKKTRPWVHFRIAMEYEGEPGYDPVRDLGADHAHLADPRQRVGELMFPQRFPQAVVASMKEDLGEYGSAGQLQQRPQPLGGGIIKSHWWRPWPDDRPLPAPLHVFASVDTAFSEKDHGKAAYSARTTWMVFEDPATGRPAMLLLSRWWARAGYPALRAQIKDHHTEAALDCTLIERKASGISLLQDLRRIRQPRLSLRGFDPGRLDKVARAHLASPMFEAGLVYYPDRDWAREVIELVSKFPNGAAPCADVTDTVTQAVIYTRQRLWARPPEEEEQRDADRPDDDEGDADGDHAAPPDPVYG